jgi:hypothetical protein
VRGFAQEKSAKGEKAVRRTRPSDVPLIAEFLKANYHETIGLIPITNREKFVMDPDYVNAFAQKAASHPDLISYIDENGMIMGDLGETTIGPNRIARGGVWYVRPEARGTPLGWRLLKAFDDEGRDRGALCARMELDNPINLSVIDRMYQKRGFRRYSYIYVKEYGITS